MPHCPSYYTCPAAHNLHEHRDVVAVVLQHMKGSCLSSYVVGNVWQPEVRRFKTMWCTG